LALRSSSTLLRSERILPALFVAAEKTAQESRERIEFEKDRLEVLRLPLKPFENQVPEFAPWPERVAAFGLNS
jgi:hypothetical protein